MVWKEIRLVVAPFGLLQEQCRLADTILPERKLKISLKECLINRPIFIYTTKEFLKWKTVIYDKKQSIFTYLFYLFCA